MKLPDAHVTVRVTKVVRTTVSPRRALWITLVVVDLCTFVSYVAQGNDVGQGARRLGCWLLRLCRGNRGPMSYTVADRVRSGAAWLDENQPGWERKIDLATLALDVACRCVLGQVFGNYWRSPVVMDDWGRYGPSISARLGFTLPPGDDSARSWDALEEAWIALIKDRFDAGALSDEGAL